MLSAQAFPGLLKASQEQCFWLKAQFSGSDYRLPELLCLRLAMQVFLRVERKSEKGLATLTLTRRDRRFYLFRPHTGYQRRIRS